MTETNNHQNKRNGRNMRTTVHGLPRADGLTAYSLNSV